MELTENVLGRDGKRILNGRYRGCWYPGGLTGSEQLRGRGLIVVFGVLRSRYISLQFVSTNKGILLWI